MKTGATDTILPADEIRHRLTWLRRSIATALLLWSTVAYALEPDVIFDRNSSGVWLVLTLDINQRQLSSGSAVVIGPGRLITNCHVLARAHGIQVRKGNISMSAGLEYADAERDLCQLNVKDFTAPPVLIGSIRALRVGQRVYAIGNPRGLELSMSEGIVSSLRGLTDDTPPLVQTTAAMSKGSSGGGLFDSEGRLIGITSFVLRDSQNLNFAIPIDWVAEVPERARAQLAKFRESTATAMPEAQPKTTEKPLTGSAFESLFSGNRVFRIVSGTYGLEKMEYKANGIVNLIFSPRGYHSGTVRTDTSAGQVCLAIATSPSTQNRHAQVAPLIGCFTVSVVKEGQYRFKSGNGTEFIGDL